MAVVRILYKLSALLAVSLLLVPLQGIVRAFARGPARLRLPRLWHRCVCRILGLRLDLVGSPSADAPTLFVGNHVSHFDIFVLGGRLPASFVAKDDMAQWPLANRLCALQDTVFISRRPPS
jgi:lyso-ornithine lipid O-acyltransferase